MLTHLSTVKFDMQHVNLGYSTKIIPIPSQEYILKLIHSAEKFIRAIRRRVVFLIHPEWKSSQKRRCRKKPGRIEELAKFEEGIVWTIQTIKFRNSDNGFQQKIRIHIASIRKDETTNFYKLEPEKHRKLLEENISKDYQRAQQDMEDVINRGNKTLAVRLRVWHESYVWMIGSISHPTRIPLLRSKTISSILWLQRSDGW